MELLDFDAISAADDRKWEDVPVPEWGGTVRIMGLSGADRDAYETSMIVFGPEGKPIGRNLANARARLVASCLVNADGERIFANGKSVAKLGSKNGAVLDRLYDKARELSGIAQGSAEVAEGNSGAAPSGSSTSA
ncbi:hypothetical protein [Streptomyces bohaiensis]|uniref:hypothetical protein n=1 Tax=Streptomyces bohaiensis TaxID=1431344 RepID=UPI003B80A6CF